MKHIPLVLLVASTLFTSAASAQFLGDALAAAGLNVSERQAGEALVATGAINDPSLGSTTSGAPRSAPVQTPEALGHDVGVRPRKPADGSAGAESPQSHAGSGPSGAHQPGVASAPPVGGAVSFAGASAYKASIDPKAAAAWRDAFRPVGSRLAALPEGAVALEAEGTRVFYVMGMFLNEAKGGFEVVPAPPGASITEKPVGAAVVFADGRPHTYYAGTFYVYDSTRRAYVVVRPPAGATVENLPDTAARVEKKDGTVVYRYAGTDYRPLYRGSTIVYTVAG